MRLVDVRVEDAEAWVRWRQMIGCGASDLTKKIPNQELTLFFVGFRRFCRNFPPPAPLAPPPPAAPPAPSFLFPFSSPILRVEQVCGLNSDARDPQDCSAPSLPPAPSPQSPSPSGPIRSHRLLVEGIFCLAWFWLWLWLWLRSDCRKRGLTCATVRW